MYITGVYNYQPQVTLAESPEAKKKRQTPRGRGVKLYHIKFHAAGG